MTKTVHAYIMTLSLMLCSALSVHAQTTTTLINDSFADGDRAITGMSGTDVEGAFFASTSSSGIEDAVGSLGLVSGPSGRSIHGIFASQSLTNIGDKLTLSYSFFTPASIEGPLQGTAGGESSAFKIGIFNSNGSNVAQDITSSTDALWMPINGFMLDHDVNTGSADLNFRERSVAGDRFLNTNGNFSSIGSSSSPDGDYGFVPNAQFDGSIMVERVSATDLQLSGAISGNGGGTTHQVTYTPTGAGAFDFDFIGFHANGNNFGSSSTPDTPDNGVDFSNISLTFTAAVPEPGSAALLLSGLLSLGLVRRRN